MVGYPLFRLSACLCALSTTTVCFFGSSYISYTIVSPLINMIFTRRQLKLNAIKSTREREQHVYTDEEDPTAERFREKSRLFNNGMTMCSVAAEKGWKNRCHNNKMECMLLPPGHKRSIGHSLDSFLLWSHNKMDETK